jgi:hypothetical protein
MTVLGVADFWKWVAPLFSRQAASSGLSQTDAQVFVFILVPMSEPFLLRCCNETWTWWDTRNRLWQLASTRRDSTYEHALGGIPCRDNVQLLLDEIVQRQLTAQQALASNILATTTFTFLRGEVDGNGLSLGLKRN